MPCFGTGVERVAQADDTFSFSGTAYVGFEKEFDDGAMPCFGTGVERVAKAADTFSCVALPMKGSRSRRKVSLCPAWVLL